MVRGWYPRGMALYFWLGMVFSGAVPAHATIHQAGANAEADALLEKAAHAAGAKHPAVVGLYMLGNDSWPPLGTGSGVYIGTTRDGKKGLILTAAHLFPYDPERPSVLPCRSIMLAFGPDLPSSYALPAARVLLHPGFTQVHPGGPATECSNDMAILEFDLAPKAEGLTAREVTPATLCDGSEDLSNVSMEAEMVGFGAFGTTKNLNFPRNVRVHSGQTLVTYCKYYGNNLLMNWAPMSDEALEEYSTGDRDPKLLNRFKSTSSRLGVRLSPEAKPYIIQTHPHHSVPAQGDSGGPLFIRTPAGAAKVAGISSRTENFLLSLSGGGSSAPMRIIASIWEPVVDHLAWIERVRDGVFEGTWVLERDKDPWQGPADEGSGSPGYFSHLPCAIL